MAASPTSIAATATAAVAATTTAAAATTASRKILGPLTTTYTPSGICTNYGGSTDDFVAFQAQGCNGGVLQDTASCWPSATIPAPNPPYYSWGFYSPGTICPSGYYSACGTGFANAAASATTSISDFTFQYPILAEETAVGCCPKYVKTYKMLLLRRLSLTECGCIVASHAPPNSNPSCKPVSTPSRPGPIWRVTVPSPMPPSRTASPASNTLLFRARTPSPLRQAPQLPS